jgi:hypothetical protein
VNHGIPSAYNGGCRCEKCAAQHRDRMTAIRTDLAARPRDEVPHGTASGYNHWRCRCEACTQANTAACREYKRSRVRRRAVGT